jgi:hypothetical protein
MPPIVVILRPMVHRYSTWTLYMNSLHGYFAWMLYMGICWIYIAAEGGPSFLDVPLCHIGGHMDRPNHMSRLRPGVGGRGVERGTERVSAQDCLQLGGWMWMERLCLDMDASWSIDASTWTFAGSTLPRKEDRA